MSVEARKHVKKFEVEENDLSQVKPNNAFTIKKSHFYLISIVIVLLFVGSILATYFGKPDKVTSLDSSVTTTTLKPIITTTVSTTISTTTSSKPINYRLPFYLKPYLYDLKIQPYIGPDHGDKSFTFDGTMKIFLNCFASTNKIVFHQEDLKIDEKNVKLIDLTKNEQLSFNQSFVYDSKLNFVTINLNVILNQNTNYSLEIPYTGNISTNLFGFYRGSYVVDGKKYYLASTDFEPTDARSAFPCFDEPAMKAKFKLTMIRENKYNTHSNSPLLKTTDHDNPNWKVDHFEETVPMSTYLMAFVVSEFKTITTVSPKYNVTIEVSARPQAIDSGEGDFGLQEAAQIIDYFSDYFDTKYPLPKSTQIAVPDFNSGGFIALKKLFSSIFIYLKRVK